MATRFFRHRFTSEDTEALEVPKLFALFLSWVLIELRSDMHFSFQLCFSSCFITSSLWTLGSFKRWVYKLWIEWVGGEVGVAGALSHRHARRACWLTRQLSEELLNLLGGDGQPCQWSQPPWVPPPLDSGLTGFRYLSLYLIPAQYQVKGSVNLRQSGRSGF